MNPYRTNEKPEPPMPFQGTASGPPTTLELRQALDILEVRCDGNALCEHALQVVKWCLYVQDPTT